MKSYGQYTVWNDTLKTNELQNDVFLNYYYENIQEKLKVYNNEGEEREIQTVSPYSFFTHFFQDDYKKEQEYQVELFKKLAADKELDLIQDELEHKGIQCCMFNMYYLCEYLKFIARNRCFCLLKPTIKETLSELNEVKKITFTNADGSTSSSDNSTLIKIILDALKEKLEETEHHKEVGKVVRWDKVANNEIMQAVFVNELTNFLHSYFNIKRKKGSVITTAEQKLVRYFLWLMGLSPAKVSDSRFRQLRIIYKMINYTPLLNLVKEKKTGKQHFYEFSYIKYDLWKQGKLDFKDPSLSLDGNFDVGDEVMFAKDCTFDM